MATLPQVPSLGTFPIGTHGYVLGTVQPFHTDSTAKPLHTRNHGLRVPRRRIGGYDKAKVYPAQPTG